MRIPRSSLVAAALAISMTASRAEGPALAQDREAPRKAAIAQILYFKAKPGKLDAYNRYIHDIAAPIDEDARKAGAFVGLTTLVNPDPNATWSHMRLFTFESREQLAAFSRKMDEATARVVTSEAQRQVNAALSASLRDRVGESVVVEVIE